MILEKKNKIKMFLCLKDREANLSAWLKTITDLQTESNDAMLAVGALVVQEIRNDIFSTLGFHCSAGLAHNKVCMI